MPAASQETQWHLGGGQQEPPAASSAPPAQVVISGAGIVGLVLALALKEHVGVTAELYEKSPAFHDDVGAGMGMYPNGLRVIRDISPRLLESIRRAGHPYLYRRWERHDGTEVAVAEEAVLSDDEDELQPIGIRRWRLQKVLYDAVVEAGIPVYFGKRTCGVVVPAADNDGTSSNDGNQYHHHHHDGCDCDCDGGLVEVEFDDGTKRLTEILFGADGSRSKVRESVAGPSYKLEYTGVTCIMGMSDLPRHERGICFPSSSTTKCHACFFPTREDEQCFQFHFPIPAEHNPQEEGRWGTLSEKVGREECRTLAEILREDGWDEKYIAPLGRVTHAVRIGFCSLKPGLDRLVYGGGGGGGGRVVLLGDAAHPPVPYIGQGAQMGLEDAGIIATLLKSLCVDGTSGTFDGANFGPAMHIYEKMRVPRTADILERSRTMGRMQLKRARNAVYNEVKEELIQRQVFFHETLPVMFPGARYDYREDVEMVLQKETAFLPVLQESGEEEEEEEG